MSIVKDFEDSVEANIGNRIEDQGLRPNMEVNSDDDFGLWVLQHKDGLRSVICGTPEFKDSPFCGTGYH